MKLKLTFSALLVASAVSSVFARQYWEPDANGGITWNVSDKENHSDHIEMAGKRVASVLRYGVDPSGAFTIDKSMVWPMLRIIPNDTRGCIMRRFGWDPLDAVTVNGRPLLNENVS